MSPQEREEELHRLAILTAHHTCMETRHEGRTAHEYEECVQRGAARIRKYKILDGSVLLCK